MRRRPLIKLAGALPMMATAAHAQSYRRVRPGEAGWPTGEHWKALDTQVGGRLIAVQSPVEACRTSPDACAAVFRDLKNPWAIGDSPALTQTSGWAGAWASAPSAYAVPARHPQDGAGAARVAR